MLNYLAPLNHINFVMKNVADLPALLASGAYGEIDSDDVETIIAEAARLISEMIAPTNRDGDLIGSKLVDGAVITPESFKQAYASFVDSGFGSISHDPTFGGGGMPHVVGLVIQEMVASANMAFSLCPMLTQSAIDALSIHGTEEQKQLYLPKLLTNEWSGTMNLTESQAGSDVGAITTKATQLSDGSYLIKGQKIFITYGDHDLAENIIHFVLARTEGSAPGTKGISMFMVPKFVANADGSLGERNDVVCVSLEHKLGIHASPTCVMDFGGDTGAIGWLIGEEGGGMKNMFTMMNNARLGVGIEGLAISERAYQQALTYSAQRVQSKAAGADTPGPHPIIDHADVRRMLMTQRSWIDAMRCLLYENAAAIDRANVFADDYEKHNAWASLLIPISKSLCTDVANEMTSLALQIHGGMGYVEETGAAQHYRDARIAAIYEGTNGIQAIDLVLRKLSYDNGKMVFEHLDHLDALVKQLAGHTELDSASNRLSEGSAAVRRATEWLLAAGAENRNDVLAGATPYLRMLGTLICGGLVAKSVLEVDETTDASFAKSRLISAKFFCEQIVPNVLSLEPAVTAGSSDLFALDANQLK